MAQIRNAACVLVLLGLCAFMRADDEITLESVPPVVVKTIPEAGKENIDAGVNEIQITFSKEMQDGSWSWSTASKESFPETTGKAHYSDDHRTCSLPVHLKAGMTYAIWVNSAKFGGFKDSQGKSAVPYLLVFKTKG